MDPHAPIPLAKDADNGFILNFLLLLTCYTGTTFFEYYEIPKPHAYCTNTKYQAVYSMWNHFTDYLEYQQKSRLGGKLLPPKCNSNLERNNIYIGKRRLPIFVDLADGKSTKPT